MNPGTTYPDKYLAHVATRLFHLILAPAGNNSNLSPAVVAGLGTVMLSVVGRVLGAIPCIGWLLVSTLSLFGLGAIILTRVGTRDYPEFSPVTATTNNQSVLSSHELVSGDTTEKDNLTEDENNSEQDLN